MIASTTAQHRERATIGVDDKAAQLARAGLDRFSSKWNYLPPGETIWEQTNAILASFDDDLYRLSQEINFLDASTQSFIRARAGSARRRLEELQDSLDTLMSAIHRGGVYFLVDGPTMDRDLLPDRTCLPFPSRGDVYWGVPADDDDAAKSLSTHREIQWLIFLAASFWWFDHYPRFKQELDEKALQIVDNDMMLAYALRK